MSEFSHELIEEVSSTVTSAWSKRQGQIVPETASLKLGNDRVELSAVLLYADLADSTELALTSQEIASEVCKAYLRGVTKIIRKNGGEIRSFDGDRVMGVFLDGAPNTQAVTCGLQINWFFRHALRTTFNEFYSSKNLNLGQTVGIDRSAIHVSRAGVRDNNDLIWVGRAPNIAAKLSGVRNGYQTLITAAVYDRILDEGKYGGNPPQDMWTRIVSPFGGEYGLDRVYGSAWSWRP